MYVGKYDTLTESYNFSFHLIIQRNGTESLVNIESLFQQFAQIDHY